ncbi:hypothetical protein [Sphingorhabdus sp. SMR4y]|uniref:hypothetical protein n=1 Tax=Sphingorhabdus sp. SMR4y TaxID=2584094 RepID=UPI000B5C1C8B|nr:hypothetical protein [Sphingorhabdus sp. SMR4y]ASK90048.1 hypothetical protein SPHFLASMR4Y_03322 [Sphingorhabdus sp. SMR4y]
MKNLFSILILAGLVACGPAQNDPGPGGVTVGEAQALDEAAKMLDERNRPPDLSGSSEGGLAPANSE